MIVLTYSALYYFFFTSTCLENHPRNFIYIHFIRNPFKFLFKLLVTIGFHPFQPRLIFPNQNPRYSHALCQGHITHHFKMVLYCYVQVDSSDLHSRIWFSIGQVNANCCVLSEKIGMMKRIFKLNGERITRPLEL